MTKRRKRWKWSDDEKRMICAQTRLPGISVSRVARRYDVNANQVFNWLKDPKFAASAENEETGLFLPVEIVDPIQPAPQIGVDGSEMIVELTCGHRLKVSGSFDPDLLAALIRKLDT